MTVTSPLYYLGNARTPEQHAEMVALEAAGICIFCPSSYSYPKSEDEPREVLLDYPDGPSYKKQVLLANGTWAILRNEYPYDGTKEHALLVPSEHVTRMDQLSSRSQAGFWEILDGAAMMFGRNYYVLGARNGDMRYTGATIAHLHIQFIVGDPDNQGEPVKLYVSSRPPDPSS